MFYEGKLVYCIDKHSPFYGKRLKVDLILDSGKPLFIDALTGASVLMYPSQVADKPDEEKEKDT